ncbi:MAG: transposase, partial [Janthinobacterium lividum]|nr:transposase [Janthinobacterium lividum]
PQCARPFVKRKQNDFTDAEAICEVASRPNTRFFTSKNAVQQTLSAPYRVRASCLRARVKASMQIHGFVLELGISVPLGHAAITYIFA